MTNGDRAGAGNKGKFRILCKSRTMGGHEQCEYYPQKRGLFRWRCFEDGWMGHLKYDSLERARSFLDILTEPAPPEWQYKIVEYP